MSTEKQIEEMTCENCVHYEGCLSAFRDSKDLGLYECSEEEYFANADECRFFYRKQSESEGEWIWKSNGYMNALHCSLCNQTAELHHKFCPNCGAKMKGE